jgi:hypothetical protein
MKKTNTGDYKTVEDKMDKLDKLSKKAAKAARRAEAISLDREKNKAEQPTTAAIPEGQNDEEDDLVDYYSDDGPPGAAVPPSDVPIPRLPAPTPEVSKPSVLRSVPIDDVPVPVTGNDTISRGRLDAIEAMLLQLQAAATPVHAATDAALPTIDINTATAPAPPAASAADSGRFKLALSHTKVRPFSGDAITDAMSFDNWLSSHVRNVAGVNSDSDVLVMAAKHLRGAALRTHMDVTREADVTDAAHFATWHQIMKDAVPGPSASQRQSIYHSARDTADLGSAQAWRLEAERVMRLIPGLPKPTDGPVHHVALVAKFVAGLPATVRNFIESVRHITDDPATCADIISSLLLNAVLRHCRQISALPIQPPWR